MPVLAVDSFLGVVEHSDASSDTDSSEYDAEENLATAIHLLHCVVLDPEEGESDWDAIVRVLEEEGVDVECLMDEYEEAYQRANSCDRGLRDVTKLRFHLLLPPCDFPCAPLVDVLAALEASFEYTPPCVRSGVGGEMIE